MLREVHLPYLLLILLSLRSGPTISILFRPYAGAEVSILSDAFPKNVVVTFSSFCNKQFPALNMIPASQLAKVRGTSVVIEGGRIESHKEVLEWMLSCCQGSGILPFKTIPSPNYWHYAQALESAQYLGIQTLQKDLGKRLSAIAARQIHSDDVRIIYSMLPAGHQLRTEAANSIGAALWEKRLQAFPAYKVLRLELPDLDADLQTFKAAMEEISGVRVMNEEKKKERKNMWIKQKVARRLLTMPSTNIKSGDIEDRITVANGFVTVKQPGEIVRKAGKGRHTYVKADLDLLGLGPDNFRPAPAKSFPRYKALPSANNVTAPVAEEGAQVK